jgi:hypothetical protein
VPDLTFTVPAPEYLTPGGLDAYRHEIVQHARALATELDRSATGLLERRGVPEHTAKDVSTARAALQRQLRASTAAPAPTRSPGPDETRVASRAALLAAILLTISTVGVGVMTNFLDGPWQYGLFALLVLIGIVGLVLTWVGGTRGRRGHPAHDRFANGSPSRSTR